MTKKKSAEELLRSDSWDLTEDKLDWKLYLQRLIQDDYFEPVQLTPIDIGDCMKKWGMVPDEFTVDNPTKQEQDILIKVLLNNWNSLSKSDKEIYHCINGTLSRWGKTKTAE